MKNLSILRKNAKMSQSDLAEKLGVTQQTISKYENGTREPDSETLKILSNIFDVSIDYLLDNDENLNIKLNKKDERDIQKALNETLIQLEKSQDGLMFDGEPLDDETREFLKLSLENSMRMAKHAAKKYTPKKYRK